MAVFYLCITDALRANLFKVAGQMVASSIMQGGPGFPVFPLSVYSYFQNPTPDDLTEYLSQEDVVDVDQVIDLTKVHIDNKMVFFDKWQFLLLIDS